PPIHQILRVRVCVSAQTGNDGEVPGCRYHAWRPSAMPLTLSQRPETAAKFFWIEQIRLNALVLSVHEGIVGDTTPLEETVETDSERVD
ncbi:hypothetical protein Taro_014553, partial [Colocasia esculenta]|nr:hypothetical protein [Colocasia esculenta]